MASDLRSEKTAAAAAALAVPLSGGDIAVPSPAAAEDEGLGSLPYFADVKGPHPTTFVSYSLDVRGSKGFTARCGLHRGSRRQSDLGQSVRRGDR